MGQDLLGALVDFPMAKTEAAKLEKAALAADLSSTASSKSAQAAIFI